MGTLGAAQDTHREDWSDLEMTYHTVAPDRWTFRSDKIREWVESWCQGEVLNACAGKTHLEIETHRNDIDTEIDADTHHDVCELADHLGADCFDTIVYDPPFSQNQANRSYGGRNVGDDALAKRQFHELLRPSGRVIQLGYSTTCMPVSLGYDREAVAIFNTLGRMNDYLGTVDRKINDDLRRYGRTLDTDSGRDGGGR